MGWEIRTPSAWPWSVQEIEQSFTRAARDDHSATRGSQDRHQTKRSTVGPKRRKLSDQLSEKAERSAVGSQVGMVGAPVEARLLAPGYCSFDPANRAGDN